MTPTKSVLIIEDEEDICATLRKKFLASTTFSYTVEIAGQPEACLEGHFCTRPFDVYVVDLQLEETIGQPQCFGKKLIEAIRRTNPNGTIIAYSAHGDPEIVEAVMRSGAARFVSKATADAIDVVRIADGLLLSAGALLQPDEELIAFVMEKATEWRRDFSGQVLALSHNELVGRGANYFEAVIAYGMARKQRPTLPEDAFLIEIPTQA